MNFNVPKKFLLAFVILWSLFQLPTVQAKDSAIIIFDGSGSMWGQIDGKHKIEIAREVMGTLVEDWNEDIALGLMAYGHREKGNCADIEVLQPVGTPDSKKILNIINKLSPKGKTPISQSLKQAAETLRYAEDPATVILISDGEETCNADPCVVSKELEAKGINFTAHVIGFDVKNNQKAREQLQCIAENTGGQFYEAEDTSGLSEALVKVQKEVEDPRPTLCKQYAEEAVKHERTNIEKECGFTGEHWHDDLDKHYGWCVGQAVGSELPNEEYKQRSDALKKCESDKAAQAKTSSKNVNGILEFNWSGDDDWELYRGDTLVGGESGRDYYSGEAKQTLQPGTYTLKAKQNVFEPFEVTIKKDETTTVEENGMLEFNWSGEDEWELYRGDTLVGGYHSLRDYYQGAAKQTLQPGTYTLKAKQNVFEPFEVTIKKGETTTVEENGMLEFNWSGKDEWELYRGDTLVGGYHSLRDYYQGAVKQTLQPGTYTLKAKQNVFEPFEVTIKKGETTTVEENGMLEFNWSGKDEWELYRGDTLVGGYHSLRDYYQGAAKQTLQPGTYTLKAKQNEFEPFEVTIKKGETLTINK